MFELAHGYKKKGMTAYSELQDAEFLAENIGYTAHRHQREVGAGWFDAISVAVKGARVLRLLYQVQLRKINSMKKLLQMSLNS